MCPWAAAALYYSPRNPMWSQETYGSFMLLLNAALHSEHLDVGRKLPAGE